MALNFDWLDQETERAVGRYQQLVPAWNGLYEQALNATDFGSQRPVARMTAQAYSIAENYLAGERDAASEAVVAFATDAHRATVSSLSSIDAKTLAPGALEHLQAISGYLIDEIVAQIHRDVATLRKAYQLSALSVKMDARGRGVSVRQALIQHRMTHDGPQFQFVDRAGRRSDSTRIIRLVWRQSLLAAYNESVLHTLADHGVGQARVTTAEPGAAHDGELIDLTAYGDIATTYFQPHARAYLSAETSNVSA